MDIVFYVVYVLVVFGFIGLILIQYGKGVDVGVFFGGGGLQIVFGSVGFVNFLICFMVVLVVVFFVISLGLVWMVCQEVEGVGSFLLVLEFVDDQDVLVLDDVDVLVFGDVLVIGFVQGVDVFIEVFGMDFGKFEKEILDVLLVGLEFLVLDQMMFDFGKQ